MIKIRMMGVAIGLLMVCMGCATGRGATIYGHVAEVGLTPARTNVTFIPLSTPLASGTTIYNSRPKTIATAADGGFTNAFLAGDYRVVVNGNVRDALLIAVPNDTNTYNWTALITTALTYTNLFAPQYMSAFWLTQKGDLLSYTGSNYVRVPIGVDGQVLQADAAEAAGLKWFTASGLGTVTSVGLTSAIPGITVSGSPVTGASGFTLSNEFLGVPIRGTVADPAAFAVTQPSFFVWQDDVVFVPYFYDGGGGGEENGVSYHRLALYSELYPLNPGIGNVDTNDVATRAWVTAQGYGTGGGGSYTFNANQFSVEGGTAVAIKSGALVTNLSVNALAIGPGLEIGDVLGNLAFLNPTNSSYYGWFTPTLVHWEHLSALDLSVSGTSTLSSLIVTNTIQVGSNLVRPLTTATNLTISTNTDGSLGLTAPANTIGEVQVNGVAVGTGFTKINFADGTNLLATVTSNNGVATVQLHDDSFNLQFDSTMSVDTNGPTVTAGVNTNAMATVEYVNSRISGNSIWWLQTNASDISGYYTLNSGAIVATQQVLTIASPVNNQYLASFAMPAGEPGVTVLREGVYTVDVYLRRAGAGTVAVKAEVYARNSGGTEYYEVATGETTTALTTSDVRYQLRIVHDTNQPIAVTDRLVVKLKNVLSSGTPDVVITVGSNTISHFESPLITAPTVTSGEPLTVRSNGVVVGTGITNLNFVNPTTLTSNATRSVDVTLPTGTSGGGGAYQTVSNITASGTFSVNTDPCTNTAGLHFNITLTAASTFMAPTNTLAVDGQIIRLRFLQDSTGTWSLSTNGNATSSWGFGSGITGWDVSTNSGSMTYMSIVYSTNGSKWHTIGNVGGY
jgi:hypothetical protein